jgi:ketosteroid isomerase-like protein
MGSCAHDGVRDEFCGRRGFHQDTIVAGGDVAFGYALMRCGTPTDLASRPKERLRVTVGLRKTDGR